MVAADYRKAYVFRQFGIDFYCDGKKTLAEACAEKNLDQAVLELALTQASVKPAGSIYWNFQQWDLAFLIDFIVNAHHAYIRAQIPRIRVYGEKVRQVDGQKWPEVIQIHALTQRLADELLRHLEKEERVLFPYIQNLVAARQYRQKKPAAPFGQMQNPISAMELEHESASQMLQDIRRLSNDYTPPADAGNSFRVWYALLQEFEEDQQLHIHLENNILFPSAIALEEAA